MRLRSGSLVEITSAKMDEKVINKFAKMLHHEISPLREQLTQLDTALRANSKIAETNSTRFEESDHRISVLETSLWDTRNELKQLKDNVVSLDNNSRRDSLNLYGIREGREGDCGALARGLVARMRVTAVRA